MITFAQWSQPELPSGIISMWHGSLASIPSGWVLCDGNNGTPDLRSKFVKGAAAGNNPGGTGGSASHTHTFTGDALATHKHGLTVPAIFAGTTDSNSAGGAINVTTTNLRYTAGTTSQLIVTAVSFAEPGHTHNLSAYQSSLALYLATINTTDISAGTPSGLNSAASNDPEYYTVAFIMKM